MQVVRIYTGEDGESHIEEMELPFEQVGHALRTATEAATGVQFSSLKPTQLVDFHTAPRRQYVITLQGQVEIGLGRWHQADLQHWRHRTVRGPERPRPHDPQRR